MMSSFDSLRPSASSRGPQQFEPLCPSEETPGQSGSSWRPLFGDVGRKEATPQTDPRPEGATPAAVTPQEASLAGNSEAPPDENARAFSAGYELGRQETRAEVEIVAESLVKSIEELATFRAQLRRRYERELLELALGVARKVLRTEVRERPEIWLGMIRDAVQRAVDREAVCIRVPALIATFLSENLPVMRAQLDQVKEIAVVEDPTLQEGGCVIETPFGDLDVGIDSQIDAVECALTRGG
jgi:flagellar assembly protein FliH